MPKVVIVEDNPILNEIFVEAMEELGFQTEVVYDGRHAIPMILNTLPALVILDLHLPNMSGMEILHTIRNEASLKDVKVIIITADLIRAEQAKAYTEYLLTKPVSVMQLQNIAKKICSIETP